ncbi:hypothetical protein EIP91_009789 [Steccherinum ochraceum]|uniref:Uncharacterized protein n=1 Tax=Steccherinum ochraceum TaxID=92696 RepID=A0A4R0RMD8_9APHY|nr:hypothetical protein EIP91_009789 [Steccherinum ochraceum]
MVDFLNLTVGTDAYIAAYCLNPPSDDSCSFGYCDNPDIAGPLVRISTYVTNFCLSIILFYSPEDAQMAMWSQLLTMFSMLLTVAISITQKSLSRLYSLLAVVISGSPLSLYLVLYSVISSVLSDRTDFAQRSCDELYGSMTAIYIIPILFFHDEFKVSGWFGVLLIMPMVSTGLAWLIALVLQRKNIWPSHERWRPHLGRIWSITGRHYSFIHFMLIVLIPTLYWITVIEISCVIFSAGQGNVLSFGQVLTVFVALPPIITVLQLWPKLFAWFKQLSWVRRLIRYWIPARVSKPVRTSTFDSVDTLISHRDHDGKPEFDVLDLTTGALKTYEPHEIDYEEGIDIEEKPVSLA